MVRYRTDRRSDDREAGLGDRGSPSGREAYGERRICSQSSQVRRAVRRAHALVEPRLIEHVLTLQELGNVAANILDRTGYTPAFPGVPAIAELDGLGFARRCARWN